ncbi:MAG TPA: hypothetical protein VKC53_00730 [Patescibacteria group bacterium]|nr:hypothetical protein [Patescibacteria group bacterium]
MEVPLSQPNVEQKKPVEQYGVFPKEIKEKMGDNYWFITLRPEQMKDLKGITLLPENFIKKEKDIEDYTDSLDEETSLSGQVAVLKNLVRVSWHEPKTADQMEELVAESGKSLNIKGVSAILGNATTYANIYSTLYEKMIKEAPILVDLTESNGHRNELLPTKSRTKTGNVIDMSSSLVGVHTKFAPRYVAHFWEKFTTQRQYDRALPIFVYQEPSKAQQA